MQKPNPFVHMLIWGVVGGIVLGTVFALAVFYGMSFDDWYRDRNALQILQSGLMLSLTIGGMFGGTAGLILGAISGGLLHSLTRERQLSPDNKRSVLLTLALVMSALAFGGWMLLLGGSPFMVGIVTIITSASIVFAANRYLNRVLLTGKPKGKPHEV